MGFKKRPVIDGKVWTLHTNFYRGIRPFESSAPREQKALALKEKLKRGGWLVRIRHGAVVYVRRPDKNEAAAKKGRSHAKTDVAFSETIQGVRIDYLTDWNLHLGKYITKGNERVSTESYLRGNAGKLAELANKKGFKRVQVGSIGDFRYSGIRTGPFLPLDTMFLARFLKR